MLAGSERLEGAHLECVTAAASGEHEVREVGVRTDEPVVVGRVRVPRCQGISTGEETAVSGAEG